MNTELENRMEDWLNAHIGYCGTCLYKKRGYCTCETSQAYDEKVGDKCSCAEYIEK